MTLLLSRPNYERWLYAIPATYASVRASTLCFFTTSATPHHKHVSPDIKHHRIPAPGLSFDRPNLPLLIEEIERSCLKS